MECGCQTPPPQLKRNGGNVGKQQGKLLDDKQREQVFEIAHEAHTDDAAAIRIKVLTAYQWREYPEALAIFSGEWQRDARNYVKVYRMFPQYFIESDSFIDATPDALKALIVVCRLPKKVARKFHDEVFLNDSSLHFVHAVQPRVQKILDEKKPTRQPRAKVCPHCGKALK